MVLHMSRNGLREELFARGAGTVTRRLLWPLGMLVVLLVGGAAWLLINAHEAELRQVSRSIKEEALGDLQQLLAEQALGLEAAQIPIVRDSEVVAALKAGDRDRLLALCNPLFEELKRRAAVTHFYFSDPDRVCLLRVHKPEKYGDQFDRFTALEAERTGKVASGIELGPLGTFTLRVVRPVFDDGQLIGYLELGKEVEDVLGDIVGTEGVEKVLAIRKDALDQTRWEAGMDMLGRKSDWKRLSNHAVIYESMPLPEKAEHLLVEEAPGHAPVDMLDEIRLGAETWRAMVQPVNDVSGRQVGVLLLLHDVTEMKAAHRRWMLAAGAIGFALVGGLLGAIIVMLRRTDNSILARQAELRSSKRRYEQLAAEGRTIVWEVDTTGRYTYISPVVEDILGYRPKEIIGKKYFYDLFPEDRRENLMAEIFSAMRHREVFVDYDNALVARDGHVVWVVSNAAPMADAAGRQLGYRGSDKDITERKRAETYRDMGREVLQILNEEGDLQVAIVRILATVKERTRVEAAGLLLKDESALGGSVMFGDVCQDENGQGCFETYCGLVLSGKTDTTNPLFTKGGSCWTNHSFPLQNMESAGERDEPVRNTCIQQEYSSVALVPVRVGDQIVGLLQLNSRRKGHFSLESIEILESIAAHIGSALMRKRSEQALRAAQEQLHKFSVILTQSSATAFRWKYAPGWPVEYASPNVERVFGYTPQEFTDGTVLFSDIVDPADLPTVAAEVEQFASDTERADNTQQPYRIHCKNGQVKWVLDNTTFIRDSDGGIEAIEGVLSDITEQVRAEQALREVNRQLERSTIQALELAEKAEAASVAKSQFLANMSHELRTPMNAVLGVVPLLEGTALSEAQREFVRLIHDGGKRLLGVINDVLDFSKIQAGKMSVVREDFDLRSLLDDLASMMAVQAHAKQLELVCFVEPGVPVALRGDAGRLRQILTNLVGNAIKFTAKGEVVVRVSEDGGRWSEVGSRWPVVASQRSEVGGQGSSGLDGGSAGNWEQTTKNEEQATMNDVWIHFAVADTGIGIPEDKIELLFQSFTQVDGSSTRRYDGTGLGLAISRQLAQLMGGDITVRSVEGEGTEFVLSLPLGRQPQPRGAESVALPESLSGVRVLVVDDNATCRQALRSTLESWGMQVAVAGGRADALTALAEARDNKAPIRLALFDATLPGEDVAELGREIRSDARNAGLSLALMTSFGERGDARLFAEAGFGAYLTKPLRHTELQQALAMLLTGEKTNSPITRHTLRDLGRRSRVLLVEDNYTNQLTAKLILQKLGLEVETANNGREALALLAETPCDLVLMDVQMPEMDGMEATQRIRAGESGGRRIPIVALTAHAQPEDRERFLAAGMDDCLVKPIDMQTLIAVLDRWLGE
jgi:PAS domain S-box-containing protein